MRQNTTKAKMRAGEAAIGPILGGNWPEMVEICAYVGFDFVLFDGEHGQLGTPEIVQLVRAAEAVGITPMARVPRNEADVILRYLDTGVQGVMVPGINTRADAERAVRSALFHPAGERGVGGSRAAGFAVRQPVADFVKAANDEILTMALLEDIQGVRNLGEILGVEGLDVVFIGPSDLSASLGYPAQASAPPVQEAIRTIVEGVRGSKKFLGTNAPDGETARRQAETQNSRLICVGFPMLVARAGREYVAQARVKAGTGA